MAKGLRRILTIVAESKWKRLIQRVFHIYIKMTLGSHIRHIQRMHHLERDL